MRKSANQKFRSFFHSNRLDSKWYKLFYNSSHINSAQQSGHLCQFCQQDL